MESHGFMIAKTVIRRKEIANCIFRR
jgi:hypothetical protein